MGSIFREESGWESLMELGMLISRPPVELLRPGKVISFLIIMVPLVKVTTVTLPMAMIEVPGTRRTTGMVISAAMVGLPVHTV